MEGAVTRGFVSSRTVKYQVTHHDTVEVPGSSPVVPTTPLAGMMPTAGEALSRASVERVEVRSKLDAERALIERYNPPLNIVGVKREAS